MGQRSTVIIGGGFYGLRIAQFLVEELGQTDVLVLEKSNDVMGRASYNNQARVHNGYHYPRSVLTALRSRVNLPLFSEEFSDAISKDFDKYYAVAKTFSKVSAKQFQRFFERIESEIELSTEAMKFFNPNLIEEAFLVKEYVFDAAKLKKIMLGRLEKLSVEIHTKEVVETVKRSSDGTLEVTTDKACYKAKYVINATYASINHVNKASKLPILPLKHELTEMCLVKVPHEMEGKAFTIMCGPFFSLMPFPDKGCYTMSHVRYTPHREWYDSEKVGDWHELIEGERPPSRFAVMKADIQRYMPEARGIEYTGESLWEIKTVLVESEDDDSRPILYKAAHGGLQNYICIMGGKIDNIYDVFRELKETYAYNR